MRIAMVGPFGFHPNKTMRSRAFNLARALVRRGHAVAMFMPPWQTPAEAGKQWTEAGVDIRYVSLAGAMPAITRRLVAETMAWQPDVVHSFKPKAYSGLVAWWLWQTRRRKLRLVTDSDDWEGWGGWNDRAPYTWLQKRFFAWQEGWGMGHCHALTVASRALQTIAWSQGVAQERVVYVPNGPGIVVSASLAHDARQAKRAALGLDAHPVLLLYSRLFEFDTARLVAVLKQVQTAVPNLAILSVGVGLYEEDAAALRDQLAEHNLLDCFLDVGWTDPAELPALLGAADVGIYLMNDTLLNRTKCPVKLADMLAIGVPVVGERVGQVTEYVVHGRTGLLFPSGDIDGVARGLIHLLQTSAARAEMAQSARTHIAAHFSWSSLAQRLEDAYSPA